ncbi:hypothetical protein WMY93_030437 [Mugilogobius chulae]|uniref:Uncharacterized protein n=1 Tax=Mugilogobius chulae TaxID=88201 RepID=A0AAW0MHX2_9GOBI
MQSHPGTNQKTGNNSAFHCYGIDDIRTYVTKFSDLTLSSFYYSYPTRKPHLNRALQKTHKTMEIATRSSWDLRISALRRMNKSLIDSELPTPKSMKAKQAKDSSCTEANTSNWRQKTKRAATLGGCSGPTKEHVLTHEETKNHDVFMTKTNSFEEFHLVNGGNLSTQTQVRKLKPRVRERYILPDFTREEAIDAFIKQSKPTRISFVQDDELAPPAAPVWPELIFPKKELYTISEVEDETDYTRQEVLEMFLRQTKLTTVNLVQGGTLTDIFQERNPFCDPESDIPTIKRKGLELQPEEKEIFDLFITRLILQKHSTCFPKSELYTILEVEDETDYTRKEIMEMFLRQTKLATVKFVQGGNLTHIVEERNPSFDYEMAPPAAPVWPELSFPKSELYTILEVEDETDYTREEIMEMFLRQTKLAMVNGTTGCICVARDHFSKENLHTIAEVEDETDYTRQEVLEMFLRQTKLATVKFVQGGNLAHIVEERNPSFDDEMAPPAAPVWPEISFPKSELYTILEVEDETDYTRQEVLEMFLRQTKLAT